MKSMHIPFMNSTISFDSIKKWPFCIYRVFAGKECVRLIKISWNIVAINLVELLIVLILFYFETGLFRYERIEEEARRDEEQLPKPAKFPHKGLEKKKKKDKKKSKKDKKSKKKHKHKVSVRTFDWIIKLLIW